GILHRDVKPQNVLLDLDGRARLSDFGSARLEGHSTLTRTGGLVGTLTYAAPELIAGRRGDGRSDVYSLGMTLYFALTQRLPANSSPHLPPTPVEGGYRPRSVRRDVPVWLDDIIARATAASPDVRFATASSLVAALEQHDVKAAGDRPRPLDACLLCGAPEPLGLRICPRCGGVSRGAADTLIFARRAMYAGDREAVAGRLQGLVGDRAQRSELMDVAAGYRALVRVPAATAEGVVEQLGRRQVPARAVRARRAWAPMPLRFYGLLGLVVGVGGTAGLGAAAALLWVSPLLAGLLLLVAQRRLQNPVVALAERTAKLPAAVEKKVIEALAQLPAGTARSLLADLVRIGQRLYSSASRSADHVRMKDQLTELLAHSCDAALDLSDLDENLAQLMSQRERLGALSPQSPDSPDAPNSPKWNDGIALAERTRDRLVQKLLEVIGLLGRARGHSSAFLAAEGKQLGELARDIERHCEAHALAAQEIEQLLGAAAPGPWCGRSRA
ncbi:MAG: serine/threonine-protein kinase, partial [Dehalococcoidia bacterium]